MNFHQLLHQRADLLQQARLANLAYACQRLGIFAARIARARLRGLVALHPCDPSDAQPWPALVAIEGSQAVIEEYFLDEEIVELADILAFLGEDLPPDGLRLRLEELEARYLPLLRGELEAAGITPPAAANSVEGPTRGPGRT
jgi:hypothetical protein